MHFVSLILGIDFNKVFVFFCLEFWIFIFVLTYSSMIMEKKVSMKGL